ncbi:Ubiquitin carboxyl-terminal hydrolase 12 [Candida viswanathii]|uniref:ubiquitinyl hydrolase 1 n=1 Tax=Candida viswanathii TaxID=5486 RepID=A0A367Y4B7_9ASCO|nr:Ubiquitin carboxyl-terminal hydrolase 12 [Candida viswanathii]
MPDKSTIPPDTLADTSTQKQLDTGDDEDVILARDATTEHADLASKRKLITDLLAQDSFEEGDERYVIPQSFLDEFLNSPVDDFDTLKQELGPINFHSVVDQNGNLVSEDADDKLKIAHISIDVFKYLSKWFGVLGQPTFRSIIINPATGQKEIERVPLIFWVHQLGKKTQPTYLRHRHNAHHQHTSHHDAPIPVGLSRTATFLDLLNLIRNVVLKAPRKSTSDFRLWFINPHSSDLPFLISIQTFLFDIPKKSLVLPNLFPDVLKDQGLIYPPYSVMVETREKNQAEFPIDQFILSHSDAYNDPGQGSGHLGLNNLGNTCYMNSALQCLLHVPEINYYFYYNIYKKELNTDNPLGYHGDVANVFGSLLKQAFDHVKNGSSIAPREFKSTIGRYSSMFSGFLQQDSQELLSWLLDALHEDLNRIYQKPYCEKPELKDNEINDPQAIIRLAETCWNQHKARNDSVIIDLFTGLYQSTLVCPDCGKTSITFDPFNDLTLPLPISKKWYHTFTIVDLSNPSVMPQRIMKLEVELKKTSNYDELLGYLSNFLHVSSSDLFLYELFQNSIYSDFQLDYNKNKFLPISDIIRDTDDVVVYVIPHNPDTDVIVPVFNAVEDADTSYQMAHFFGIPLFVVLNKEVDLNSFGFIRKKLVETASLLTNVDLVEEYEKIKRACQDFADKEFYSKLDFPALMANGEGLDGKDPNDDDEGYDSDVSLANPYLGANFGFKILYVHDYSPKLNTNIRGRYNFSQSSKIKQAERVINVPTHKPTFSDFKPLADQLSDLKRNYYHYPDYKKLDDEMDKLVDEVNQNLADQAEITSSSESSETASQRGAEEAEGFVLVNNDGTGKQSESQMVPPPPPPPPPSGAPLASSNLGQINSSDEETESEANLGSLFDSTANIPLPPPSTYSDSTKPSNMNSPLENNYDGSSTDLTSATLISKDTVLLCDWDNEIYQRCFGDASLTTWETIPSLPNKELEKNKAHFERQRKAKITLLDCLNSFSTPEILGEHDLWYCPNCKDHKRATKTIQLWSTGDILTIHLKRFHSARAFSDKIDVLVDFPIEGLDMSQYVANPSVTVDDCIYDLIAVDNHYGGLGGGHYTASVKNFRDHKWYYFNDSRVTEITNPEEVVANSAYLLFYRKRSSASNGVLGGKNLIELLEKGKNEYSEALQGKKRILQEVGSLVNAYSKMEQDLIEEQERKRREEEGEDEDDEEEEPRSSDSNESSKKSRPFDELKDPNSTESPVGTGNAQFNFDEDNDYDYEAEEVDDNIRKQRLVSKDPSSNKLVHIKSNGRQEVTSSPVPIETDGETDYLTSLGTDSTSVPTQDDNEDDDDDDSNDR